jgi:hypothetical protein
MNRHQLGVAKTSGWDCGGSRIRISTEFDDRSMFFLTSVTSVDCGLFPTPYRSIGRIVAHFCTLQPSRLSSWSPIDSSGGIPPTVENSFPFWQQISDRRSLDPRRDIPQKIVRLYRQCRIDHLSNYSKARVSMIESHRPYPSSLLQNLSIKITC